MSGVASCTFYSPELFLIFRRKEKPMRIPIFVLMVVAYLATTSEGSVVGYWRFEEGAANAVASGSNTVLDSSGNGLNGTPINGPVYRTDVPVSSLPSNTRSMEFATTAGRRVTVPDGPLVTLTHSLTLEAFIKARPLLPGTGGFGVIVMRADNQPGLDPYILGMQSPGNVVSFQIMNSSNQTALLTSPVPYDQWLHVAGTLDDATGAMKLFVNGIQVASTTTSIRPLGALNPAFSPGLSIGEDYTGQYGECFNGFIDEVRISDTALAPGQLLPEPGSAIMLVFGAGMMARCRRRSAA
jgi:hypothetical protein